MKNIIVIICLGLVVFFTGTLNIYSQVGNGSHQNWCGTMELWKEKMARTPGGSSQSPEACPTYGLCDNPDIRENWIPTPGETSTIIKLVIHTTANSDGSNPISSPTEVESAINNLNQDYLQAGIQFEYTLDQINNDTWRSLSEGEINAMKIATAIKPDSQLNIWVTYVEFGYSFGTFPFDGDALTATGGIIMGHFHWGPSNSVLAHEVGHCLGLFHTFTGVDETVQCGPCYEYVNAPNSDVLGDFCSDTPPAPTNHQCSNAPGTDPCSGLPWATNNTQPENYMSYAPSWCLSLFTPKQSGRMQCWTDDRLSGWISGVDYTLSNTFGSAPMQVDFTATSSKTINSWQWDFDDGYTANIQNPTHTYVQPGYYSPILTAQSGSKTYLKRKPGSVSVYSDTLFVDTSFLVSGNPGELVNVEISGVNYLPIQSITLPFNYNNSNIIRFDSVSIVGHRTEHFPIVSVIGDDKNNSRAAIRLTSFSGTINNVLLPGTGTIASLWFTVLQQINNQMIINIQSYVSYTPSFKALAGYYEPFTNDGVIMPPPPTNCCIGKVGDANGLNGDNPTVGDITAIIDYLFGTGAPLNCLSEADTNQSGGVFPSSENITVADISVIIDHLFQSGNPLPDCI